MGVVYGIRPEWIDNNLAKWYGISSGIVTDGLIATKDLSPEVESRYVQKDIRNLNN